MCLCVISAFYFYYFDVVCICYLCFSLTLYDIFASVCVFWVSVLCIFVVLLIFSMRAFFSVLYFLLFVLYFFIVLCIQCVDGIVVVIAGCLVCLSPCHIGIVTRLLQKLELYALNYRQDRWLLSADSSLSLSLSLSFSLMCTCVLCTIHLRNDFGAGLRQLLNNLTAPEKRMRKGENKRNTNTKNSGDKAREKEGEGECMCAIINEYDGKINVMQW